MLIFPQIYKKMPIIIRLMAGIIRKCTKIAIFE